MKFSMKPVFVIAAGLFLTACKDGIDAGEGVIIVSAGTVLTMSDDMPAAEAIAIKDQTLLAIGAEATLKGNYPEAKVIDLSGKTILPGIIDSHVHVRELGMDRLKADLVGVMTAEDIVARLKDKYPNPKAGEWLIGQGWDEGALASRGYPDREVLDVAFPENPIKLESLHGFAGFYNGKALEIAGIDAATPDPEGGTILKRPDGTPTGVMLVLAQGLVNIHVPEPDQAMYESAIKTGLTQMRDAGVTSIHEAGMTPIDVAAFEALAKRGELPIRVYGMLDGNNEPLMQDWFAKGYLDDPEDWLDIRGVKVFYDGSLGSRTALLREPYSDHPEKANPTERITPQAVTSLAERSIRTGFQMAVHAIGDEGNDRTLRIYEAADAGYPNQDHRWRIEHAQVVRPDYYDRAAKLGVLSSMQSSHAVGDSPWAEDRLGPNRIQHAYAWQKILDAGGRVMMNSDLPGEPWTPMETLYFAVTRKRLDGTPPEGWYAEQALSPQEALRAMTIENAYGAFQEDKLGSLEAGKWADFIVLDQNPLQAGDYDLKDITVEQVWIAGQRQPERTP